MSKFDYNVGEYIIIYAYALPNVTTHIGHLKIGKASIKFSDYANAEDKNSAVEMAARARIKEQLGTADLNYDLVFCNLAIDQSGKSFMDHEIHSILQRSGFSKVQHTEEKTNGEWFAVNLETVKNAFEAARCNRKSLNPNEIITESNEINFRKGSQTKAIEKTIAAIEKGKKHFLWDAKMRFGKTLTSLEIARRMGYGKVLIITHRPEVNNDWFNDFNTLFAGTSYRFGSRNKGEDIADLQKRCIRRPDGTCENPFVYFASIQYLRHQVKSPEKLAILREDWDMLIIDEADEGVKTALADETISQIKRNFTLMLSGTPFNLLEDYNDDEIFSWDYTKEQELKRDWDEKYPGEPNPYYKLPRLSIYTYKLDKYLETSEFENLYDKAFNFKEFFRTDQDGNFIHEKYVHKFLDLITTPSESNFPYSSVEFRNNLRHTLWIVPGVKEARALEKLLREHPIFGMKDNAGKYYFNIANVAGDGNEEVAEKESRKLVRKAITNDPLSSYSITISCGKMTRGVSVPEWSAVFMLSNTSSASTYLQTIFRAQTPWEYEGILKTECFVFDFAPDRTLNVVAETMKIKKKSPTKEEVKEATGKFLNFCPVISATDGKMEEFSTQRLLHAIKRVAIQKVTRNGFDDNRLYNLENLSHCTDEELADFAELNKIVGQSSSGVKDENKIKMADNGFTEEEYEQAEQAEKKKKEKRELTPEEQELLRRKREIAEQRRTRISILRGVSIRMPMLIYGCKVDQNGHEIKADEEITLEQFIDNVDDASWQEFMPEGVTKEMLRTKFAKYYDEEVFVGAGIDIRLRALAADYLAPSERVMEIGEIFKSFKNPDKETVLTPWKVVNTHISSTLGGADFNHIIELDEEVDKKGEKLGLPNWEDQGEITNIWSNENAKVLEINSKSGLYPLLCAYNFYDQALARTIHSKHTDEENVFRQLWDEILDKNIYVLTKSPMAKTITERTLAGYTGAKTNIVYIPELVEKLKDESFNLGEELTKEFNLGDKAMLKFDAVVGNPPYHYEAGRRKIPIYQDFVKSGSNPQLTNYASFITPDGFIKGGQQLESLREYLSQNNHLRKIIFYKTPIFPNVAVEAAITLFDNTNHYDRPEKILHKQDGGVEKGELDWFYRDVVIDERKYQILKIYQNLVLRTHISKTMADIIPGRAPFGLNTKCFKSNSEKFRLTRDDNHDTHILVGEGEDFYWINPSDDFSYPGSDGRIEIVKYTNIEKWKMVFPKAGTVDKKPLITRILKPGEIFTDKYLCIFADSEQEALNAEKYFNSKFYRAGLDSKATSWIFYRQWHGNIPVQDFTNNSDIDWSKSSAEINRQLYEKYGFTDEDIKLIESRIEG
jgi:superfamily II DNA or RNA helicase